MKIYFEFLRFSKRPSICYLSETSMPGLVGLVKNEEKRTKEEHPRTKNYFPHWTSAALQIRPFPLVKVLQSFDSRRQEIPRHRKGKLVESFLSSYISEQRKFSKRNKCVTRCKRYVTLLNDQVLNIMIRIYRKNVRRKYV